MVRQVVIWISVVIFGLAFFVLATRDKSASRNDSTALLQREPRIVLEDFIAYRTKGQDLKATWSARLAHLFEPGELELHGDVRGIRYADRGEEVVSCETASIFFETSSLTSLAAEARLKKAEFKRFVEVAAQGHVLLTDQAEYIADTQVLQSDKAVKIEGPNRTFAGEKGFRYEVAGDKLELFGKINGQLITEREKSY